MRFGNNFTCNFDLYHKEVSTVCMHIAQQCVLILLMLTMELLSRSLSVSFAANSMINVPAHFCSALEPEACPRSMGIIREGLIHLNHTRVQWNVAEELPHNTFRLLSMCVFSLGSAVCMCPAPVYVWVSGWVWSPCIFISPHHTLTCWRKQIHTETCRTDHRLMTSFW